MLSKNYCTVNWRKNVLSRFFLNAALLSFCLEVFSTEPLVDFENLNSANTSGFDIKVDSKLMTIKGSDLFATSGRNSLLIDSPKYDGKSERWPGFRINFPNSDWTDYDRVSIDCYNPKDYSQIIKLMIYDSSDKKKRVNPVFLLPGNSVTRQIVSLGKLKRNQINVLHFYVAEPKNQVDVFIDNIRLLKPGEPEYADGESEQRILRYNQNQADKELESVLKSNSHPIAKEIVDFLRKKPAQESFEQTLERLSRINRDRINCMISAWESSAANQTDKTIIGAASSMNKVLPYDFAFKLDAGTELEIALAKNETESLQLIVLPLFKNLKNVRLNFSGFSNAEGVLLPTDAVTGCVTGFVKTDFATISKNTGDSLFAPWWPDPILTFMNRTDIEAMQAQPFWLKVTTRSEQAAGVYKGSVSVCADNMQQVNLRLAIRVYNFILPSHSPLPMAISFYTPKIKLNTEWKHKKFEYADFLAKYFINYDNIYLSSGEPDFELLEYLHKKNLLVSFNLGSVFGAGIPGSKYDLGGDKYTPAPKPQEAVAMQLKKDIERLKINYDKAKKLGILDHAYIYGFDERSKDELWSMGTVANRLKQEFPEVFTLFLGPYWQNDFYCLKELKNVDAFVPGIFRIFAPNGNYEPIKAEQARRECHKKIWWYDTGSFFAMDNKISYERMLMGMLTIKYRPDGFLYYCINRWFQEKGHEQKPINNGPFTDWNHISYGEDNLAASWLCMGPNGSPMPTIRLENFRDGLEDYAYYCILQKIVEEMQKDTSKNAAFIAEANKALEVPKTLVRAANDSTADSEQIYQWRRKVADLIEKSGMSNINPWGSEFNVRGFTK